MDQCRRSLRRIRRGRNIAGSRRRPGLECLRQHQRRRQCADQRTGLVLAEQRTSDRRPVRRRNPACRGRRGDFERGRRRRQQRSGRCGADRRGHELDQCRAVHRRQLRHRHLAHRSRRNRHQQSRLCRRQQHRHRYRDRRGLEMGDVAIQSHPRQFRHWFADGREWRAGSRRRRCPARCRCGGRRDAGCAGPGE